MTSTHRLVRLSRSHRLGEHRQGRGRVVAGAAATLVLLAGCASIPTEGPVAQGDVVLAETNTLFLQVYGPTANATPEQIVRGFLSAQAAGVNEAFATAREFLTDNARQDWDPYGQVTVYSGDLGLTTTQAPLAPGGTEGGATTQATEQPAPDLATVDEVVLSGPASVTGVVDVAGQYVEASKDARQDVSFALAKDATGQWRIDGVSDGVLVSQPNFASVYRSTPVYFLSQDLTTLVPELRWFPQRNIATNAVRALLAGPSEWMRDAVVSGAPAGTALSVEAVSVDSTGTASVDLTGPVLAADEDQRSLLSAQLEATLQRISGVSDVVLTVGGAALTVNPHADLERDPPPDGPALGVQSGTVVQLEGRQLTPVAGMPSLAGATAIASRGDVVVVRLGSTRLARLQSGAQPAEMLAGPDLVAPSVDRFGWVWTATDPGAGGLTAVRVADGTRIDLVVDWLAGLDVRQVRVSRDGARVVVLSAGADGAQVDVAGIVRDPDGGPQRLNAPVPVGGSLASASDAAWVDEVTLAVLGDPADGEAPGVATSVSLVPVGGQTESLQPVESADGVAAGRGKRAVYVRTAAGELFTRSTTGTNWSLVTTGLDLFDYPG